eukprot:CAMPEP_0113948860 /NCGR_PEP_ID=MMETSP1339-20121228/72370_1 /TAXON_ID=94617 /ORGANISM="Fibrocapsa japonica" /LENGTH=66 /DNA_ID=CAMNT_0000956047 /DNA_START=82 /DNA_END=279 /DNA_ORIENTATION=+ /assembly_acc=CAM_ASM_000762
MGHDLSLRGAFAFNGASAITRGPGAGGKDEPDVAEAARAGIHRGLQGTQGGLGHAHGEPAPAQGFC